METIFFKGQEVHTYGDAPAVGSDAPDFCLTSGSLEDVTLDSLKGNKVVLNVFPSLDTPVCAASVRRFNKDASGREGVKVVCVSQDLPFAISRFCTTEGLDDVIATSAFRSPEFARDYGLLMVDGPLKGLLARAVIVIDENGKVIYREVVDEITEEPDYAAAESVL